MIESIIMAIVGGGLIGLAASAVLFFSGRIAGISGILGGLFSAPPGEIRWHLAFLGGLLAGGLMLSAFWPGVFEIPAGRSLMSIGIAGLLVGVGTRMGSGCTSGHGVCGLSRFSVRSLVATGTFMVTGALTATLMGLFTGGVQ
jgi:uncharacterized membrane protein YedE/YeeE